jgi:hypothetical protein
MTILASIVALAALLLLMGMIGADQAGGTRRMLEGTHARRLLDLVAASAFEEACAQLEKKVPPIKLIVDDDGESEPDIPENRMESFQEPVDPRITRRAFAGQGVELSHVSSQSSPWEVDQSTDRSGNRTGLAYGIVELSLTIKVHVDAMRISRTVKVRRYITVEPLPGQSAARIVIQPNNLAVFWSEAS